MLLLCALCVLCLRRVALEPCPLTLLALPTFGKQARFATVFTECIEGSRYLIDDVIIGASVSVHK